MKKLSLSLLTLFIALVSVQLAHAQLFEDFEGGEKKAYAGNSADFLTGSWYFEDSITGSDAKDFKNGSKSVRIRDGYIRMNFDKADGAQDFTFLAGNSSFSGDGKGVLQVYYSVNGGTDWVEAGGNIILTGGFNSYSVPIEKSENIRFRINKVSGGRVNIDDILISDYITAEENATIIVRADGTKKDSGTTASFPAALVGTTRTISLSIMNTGTPELTLSSVNVTGQAFSINNLSDSVLAFSESANLTVTYQPTAAGTDQGTIEITSNANNHPIYTLNLEGEAIVDGEIITIAEARSLSLGSRVSVTGRVTVANELGGPLYMQDATAGLAVFYPALHENVNIGDSVTVTGPLSVFNPISGTSDSGYLLQIAERPDDTDIIFEVINTENKKIVPKIITIAELLTGVYEAQLIELKGVTINHTGVFQGEKNYKISDSTGSTDIRIDSDTNLPGATAPEGATDIIAVVSKFNAEYQILPRFTEDIGVEEKVYPGDEISKEYTLDIAAWNIEWFGHSGNGPADKELQFENVKTVITTMDMDVYALTEISDLNQFNRLVNDLEDYGGFFAGFASQTQNTAFLFKRSVIDSLDSGLITAGMEQNKWANGRYPLEFRFNATINNESREIYAYAIHAKAMDDMTSYNQRLSASGQMKAFLDNNRSSDNVIFLGDYNDMITTSMTAGMDSPYKNFDDDVNYTIITKTLEEAGAGSYRSQSMIDHITINAGLTEEYMVGSERVENTKYVGSYLSTTSDHYPVWTRFTYGNMVSNENGIVDTFPTTITLKQNYPNPFNPSTVISYTLNKRADVKLQVFDITGRDVATLVNRAETEGEKSVTFDASALSSGLYFYRLTTSEGTSITKKMMLIK